MVVTAATATTSVVQRIATFNQGRESERLALKYRAMRSGPFAFLRGTYHLFYEDLPDQALFTLAPPSWICGDLHLENFGSYKGDNRLVYFDINDFDEAALAPCTWEIVRTATSILVATQPLGFTRDEGIALCLGYLNSYSQTLTSGKARWIDRDAAQGLIARLFDNLRERSRGDHIASRTLLHKGKRLLNTDGRKALPATTEQREKVFAFMADFATRQENPDFYRPIDVARRVAGTGSLGIERYVILIQGKGGEDGQYLLDLKQALPSSLEPWLKTPQPRWRNHAERVVAVQNRMQAVAPAFLHVVELGGVPCVLKGLQPSQDRVNLEDAKGDLPALQTLVGEFGRITAWDQLRSSGRQGSAIADALIAFASEQRWIQEIIEVAVHCAEKNQSDWEEFRETSLS